MDVPKIERSEYKFVHSISIHCPLCTRTACVMGWEKKTKKEERYVCLMALYFCISCQTEMRFGNGEHTHTPRSTLNILCYYACVYEHLWVNMIDANAENVWSNSFDHFFFHSPITILWYPLIFYSEYILNANNNGVWKENLLLINC